METQNEITYEKPKTLTSKNVCYWFEKSGQLLGNQKSKARKFVDLDLIRKGELGEFKVLPIQGYNVTTHTVRLNSDKCSCQFFTRFGKECSHIKAVKLKLFMERWNGN